MIKLHITDEQWNEITDAQKEFFRKIVNGNDSGYIGAGSCNECGNKMTPNIGQMIGFLLELHTFGLLLDHFIEDSYIDSNFDKILYIDDLEDNTVAALGWEGCLCDKLWLSVKNRFNKLKELKENKDD